VAFAIVEVGHRFFQEIAPQAQLLALAEHGFLALALVDQPVLPFSFAVAAQRRVQRVVGAGQAAVHADHIGFGNIELGGDLL
jgi:hypothetical protein